MWDVVCAQDDIYQPWEDQLPYSEFSARLPKASIPDIVPLLSEITDEEYLNLRAGLAKHWRAFIWDRTVGGTAVSHFDWQPLYTDGRKTVWPIVCARQHGMAHPVTLQSHRTVGGCSYCSLS